MEKKQKTENFHGDEKKFFSGFCFFDVLRYRRRRDCMVFRLNACVF